LFVILPRHPIDAQYEVFDALGRLVLNDQVSSLMTVRVANFPAGVYTVRVRFNVGAAVERLVIAH